MFGSINPSDDRKSMGLDFSFVGPEATISKQIKHFLAVGCSAVLHSADGRTRNSLGEFKLSEIVESGSGVGSVTLSFSFPWTRNEFDEAWIEFRLLENVYYFEMPYGFTRDPTHEICLANDNDTLRIPDSILPFVRGAKVSWWHHAEYDLGEVEPGWQILLWVSNPFNTRCDVVIRPLQGNEEVPAHLKKIKVKLIQKGERPLVAQQLLGIRHPESPNFSIGSIESNFSTNPADHRCWGHYELAIGEKVVTVMVPSSLFHYRHGVADPYRDSEKVRSLYGPLSIDSKLPFYHHDDKDLDVTIRVGGTSSSPFLLRSFKRIYSKLKLETSMGGERATLESLANGKTEIVILNREPGKNEVERYVEIDGEEPVFIPIAINRVGIFVRHDNPLYKRGLTLAEAEAIFSKTRERGHKKNIELWGDLGFKDEWAAEPIRRYSGWETSPVSDALSLFKRQVMTNGEFRKFRVREGSIHGSWRANYNYGVDDKFGIGIGTVRSMHDQLKVVPLGDPPALPTAGECYRGSYPLTEQVYMVVSKRLLREKNKLKLNAVREITGFVLSRQGQSEMLSSLSGYLPLTYHLAKSSAAKIGLELPVRHSYSDLPPAIAGALSKTNSPAEIEELVLELSEPFCFDYNPSCVASRLIAQWQRSRNVAPLVETVNHYGDSRSAISAAVALVALGQTEYWTSLENYSKSPHKEMLSWLIHEVGELKHDRSIELLIGLLDDEAVTLVGPRTTIADEALRALRSLSNQNFGKDKSKWKQWWISDGRANFNAE